jgi:hypothetical protein
LDHGDCAVCCDVAHNFGNIGLADDQNRVEHGFSVKGFESDECHAALGVEFAGGDACPFA